MKDITDDTYYEIDTEEFAYSPYAPVSEERIKREKNTGNQNLHKIIMSLCEMVFLKHSKLLV
jgi:hypothetical protein